MAIVSNSWVQTPEEALAALDSAYTAGAEGIILRNPDTQYKHGRATNELYKIKCLDDAEAMFAVGTGFTAVERQEIWAHPEQYVGRTLTYTHLPHGAKDKPRHPVFKCWRPHEI